MNRADHEVYIAPFRCIVHPGAEKDDMDFFTQHRGHGAANGQDVVGGKAHGLMWKE